MKSLILVFIVLLVLSGAEGCSSDSPVTPVNPPDPPTAQDSIPILYSPANGQQFNNGDTVRYSWSHANHFAFIIEFSLDSNFTSTNWENVYDTTFVETINCSGNCQSFWRIVPKISGVAQYQYKSAHRFISVP